MKDHFSAGQKNAPYHSPKIPNDLIAAVEKWIQQKLTQEIKAAKFFTVYANEGMDVANKEQLPLIIIFVDQSGMIQEEFLEFVLCDIGTSGQAIADKTKFTLEKFTLYLNDLRGQGYDEAGNMPGKYSGAAAIFQHDYPKALYIHCVAHVLNLCLVAACSIQAIRNIYGVVEEICLFFNYSLKWQQELEEHIENLPVGTASKTKLLNYVKHGG